ncbi:MAG: glycosyltransferase [Promethearchaeota archaeon]
MKPLAWVGHFRGYGGFARATRLYFETLAEWVDDLVAAPLAVLEDGDPLARYVGDVPDGAFEVVNHLPTTDPEADGYFSVTEFDGIPPGWEEPLNQASVILTQSTFCRDVFARHVDDPGKIKVVPYILSDEFSPEGPSHRFVAVNRCAFGSVFEWVPRKLPELLVRAFVTEFSPEEPATLVLRASNVPEGGLEACTEGLEGNKDVVLVREPIPDLASFYRGLDVYVSCTAGEGWGQTLSEARACGVPTIAARHSGNLDFMDDGNSYLVEVHDWSPVPGLPGLNWKVPKLMDLRAAMRHTFEQWKSGDIDPRALEGCKIRKRFSRQRVGRILRSALEEFLC